MLSDLTLYYKHFIIIVINLLFVYYYIYIYLYNTQASGYN